MNVKMLKTMFALTMPNVLTQLEVTHASVERAIAVMALINA